MVAEKLQLDAEIVRAEGWKWIEVAPDFSYGHTYALRQLRGEQIPLSEAEQAARDALQAEMEELEETYNQADELPEEADRRLGEIEEAMAALNNRPVVFDPQEIVRAGAFVSIDASGNLRVERGYIRQEDELPVEPVAEPEPSDYHDESRAAAAAIDQDDHRLAGHPDPADEPDEDEGLKSIPDRLMTELTAHKTLALPACLGRKSRCCVHRRAACALSQGVLLLCAGHLPRARFKMCAVQRPSAGIDGQCSGKNDRRPA